MAKKNLEVLVGLFVLLGIIGALFLALRTANLGNVGRGDTYTVYARFDNIGGLKVRAPVRSAGVAVGHVTNIKLDPKSYQGVVTMQIDTDFRFPKDTVGKILTAGLLGDQYIGLEPGGDDKNIAAGETLAQTQSAVVLENLIGSFLTSRAADAGSPAGAASGAQQ
jgi:phospholipid/cholesterol/gamma-HCH transport system substrate-binding protein